MNIEELHEVVWDEDRFMEDPFAALQALTVAQTQDEIAGGERGQEVRSLIIRCLEYREHLNGERELLDSLVGKLGLFPYLTDETGHLSAADQVALEFYRPESLGDEVVFHSTQAFVYQRLLDGNNVILSAPTSFGKSLLIDAIMMTGRHRNLLIIVPTLALIDETRRRLASRRSDYKIVTHASQSTGERNVFVLTQERYLERDDMPEIDFFAVDEFYMLDGDDERAELLNRAFYRLRGTGAQYFLLGPNIESLSDSLPDELREEFIHTEDATVALQVRQVARSEDSNVDLVGLCQELDEPTLIYTRSPEKAHQAAAALLDSGIGQHRPELDSAVQWAAENFHPDWLVGRALSHGIGIHHAQMPRALGQFMVKCFEDGRIDFLICTSSLIEGVNTKAKNVVIRDNYRGLRVLDRFTFNNILGRGGRMFRHFTGTVYLFDDAPADELFQVDIPILSQGEDAPTSLLLHVDDGDLKADARARLEPVLEQHLLPRWVLEANTGLDPEKQIALAEVIAEDPEEWWSALGWRGYPEYDELKATCEAIWDYLPSSSLRSGYVRSASQLAFRLDRLSRAEGARGLIEQSVQDALADEAVRDVSNFLRNVAGHTFPMRLRALERIQEVIFERADLRPGRYGPYAVQVENLFLPNPLIALDEYGVPPELARKLIDDLRPEGNLDAVLARLAAYDLDLGDLSEFERELLLDAQRSL